MAKRRADKVLFVASHVTREYYALLDPKKRDAIKESMTKPDQTYDNAYFLDMSADARFGTTDFSDAGHLNAEGSQKITQIVNELIRSL